MQEGQWGVKGKLTEAWFDLKTLLVSELNAYAKGKLAKKQWNGESICGGVVHVEGQQAKGRVCPGMKSERGKEAEERVGH